MLGCGVRICNSILASSRPDFLTLKLRELADRLHCRLEGDGDVEIRRVAGIERAEPGDLTFVANPRYQALLASTRASAVILSAGRGKDAPPSAAALYSDNPYLAFAQAVALLHPGTMPAKGVDRLSAVAPDATLGAD